MIFLNHIYSTSFTEKYIYDLFLTTLASRRHGRDVWKSIQFTNNILLSVILSVRRKIGTFLNRYAYIDKRILYHVYGNSIYFIFPLIKFSQK